MEQWKRELEKQYEWQRKGKTFKTIYFGALKELYGAIDHDKDSQVERTDTNGSAGANPVCGVVKKTGV